MPPLSPRQAISPLKQGSFPPPRPHWAFAGWRWPSAGVAGMGRYRLPPLLRGPLRTGHSRALEKVCSGDRSRASGAPSTRQRSGARGQRGSGTVDGGIMGAPSVFARDCVPEHITGVVRRWLSGRFRRLRSRPGHHGGVRSAPAWDQRPPQDRGRFASGPLSGVWREGSSPSRSRRTVRLR